MQNIHKLITKKNEIRATNETLDKLFLKKRIFKLINWLLKPIKFANL